MIRTPLCEMIVKYLRLGAIKKPMQTHSEKMALYRDQFIFKLRQNTHDYTVAKSVKAVARAFYEIT